MLVFDAKRIFKLRDVSRPYTYLIKNGFTHMTATNLIKGSVSAPKIEHIERLCRLFTCTPNDLFQWISKDGEEPVAENHPLTTLRREKVNKGLNEIIRNLPLEKLGEAENLLKSLNESGEEPLET